MSSTSVPTDFSDLYTDLQQRVRVTTGVTATENQAKRYINLGLTDMHVGFGEKFWWAERDAVLLTHPSYDTGTVAITQGATALVGTDTLWNTNNAWGEANARVGGKVVIAGTNEVYEVTTVTDDTNIVISPAYVKTTETTGEYYYFEDEYDLHSDFARPIDLQRFSNAVDIPLIDRVEFRRAFPRNALVGRPTIATLIAQEPSGSAAVRRRVRLHKAPDSTVYSIPYAFVTNKLGVSSSGTEQTGLSADADEPIVPLQYRHAIVYHALINWYRDKKDDARSVEVAAAWAELLQRIVGDSEIGSPRPSLRPVIKTRQIRRPWNRSTSAIGRFTTGSRFDEIR